MTVVTAAVRVNYCPATYPLFTPASELLFNQKHGGDGRTTAGRIVVNSVVNFYY